MILTDSFTCISTLRSHVFYYWLNLHRFLYPVAAAADDDDEFYNSSIEIYAYQETGLQNVFFFFKLQINHKYLKEESLNKYYNESVSGTVESGEESFFNLNIQTQTFSFSLQLNTYCETYEQIESICLDGKLFNLKKKKHFQSK